MTSVPIDRAAFGRVIAVMNGKGGVYKTTLTANIGGLLARSGWKVLLVDVDPQGNLGLDLGYRHTDDDDGGRGLARALGFGGDAAAPIQNVRECLDVIPGGTYLDQGAAALSSIRDEDERYLSLARVLAPIVADYDVVLIDCPPGGEVLQAIALAAARWVLIPTKSDEGSLEGMSKVADRVDQIEKFNPDLELLGVVLTGVGASATAVDRQVRDDIARRFSSRQATFKHSVRHAESTAVKLRRDGRLAHEAEADRRNEPRWWEIRAGKKAAGDRLTPASAKSVADDLYAIAQELVGRVVAAEQPAPVAEGAR